MKDNVAELSNETAVLEMTDAAVTSAGTPESMLIEGVNWTVKTGEFWVVGGLPGSGKSDLLAAAAGLVRLQMGAHRLFGHDISQLSEEEKTPVRLRVGLVFANEGRLFTHLTVAENLALPLCYHRNCQPDEARESVQKVLEATGLTAFAHSTPGTINRNLRSKVALARALVLSPELLFLDNPLRGMDPRQVRWWIEFLAALRAGHEIAAGRQLTLVVTTDDFRLWIERGRQFALIKEKQWLLLGEQPALKEHEEPLLRELLSSGLTGN